MRLLIILLSSLSFALAQVNVAVSILPQETFVKKIGGDKVSVMTLVEPGESPHSYEPKPSQMIALSEADIYFPIKIDFENAWLEKFESQNKDMEIVQMSKGVQRIMMEKKNHNKKGANEQTKNKKIIKPDPHVWLSPLNVKIMAKNIYDTLIKVDSKNKSYYKKNLISFLKEINSVDMKIHNILLDVPANSKFMVFHPAWGYFARDYGLVQFAVEKEGKEPTPKALMKIIQKAKAEKIKAILVQKEFSKKSANALADELNIKVVEESPLSLDWGNNLISIAKTIANNQ